MQYSLEYTSEGCKWSGPQGESRKCMVSGVPTIARFRPDVQAQGHGRGQDHLSILTNSVPERKGQRVLQNDPCVGLKDVDVDSHDRKGKSQE